jgi:hypothetical protein
VPAGPRARRLRKRSPPYDDFGSITNIGTGAVLTDPGGSTANSTRLVMGPDRGDLSGRWHVSFRHYVTG